MFPGENQTTIRPAILIARICWAIRYVIWSQKPSGQCNPDRYALNRTSLSSGNKNQWTYVGMENCKIINQTYVIPFVYFPNVSWRCYQYNHTSMQKLNYTRCQIVPIFKFTNRTIRSADISHWTKPTIMLSWKQCKARDISCNFSWFVSALVYIIWPWWSSPQWRPGGKIYFQIACLINTVHIHFDMGE